MTTANRVTMEVLSDLEAAGVDIKTICQQLLSHIAANIPAPPEELRKRRKMNKHTMSPGERYRRELRRRGQLVQRLS
ncbi:hypothetical protein [Pseudomonas coronafaciens]|uniref:hypothetical protein n=1 Tax=Pseudomonas coronafaciens TaxID=53409 RepID=UPI000EFF6197|nr:hypothetical protein [Pseudomonas coronafaciens]RMV68256.1 hypothetical protein ALP06_03998 [Pseudomonas coronafaciens pv. atropurpurea]